MNQADDDPNVTMAVTAVVREADQLFERVGGTSRHWVRECFLPLLNKAGWRVTNEPHTTACRHCCYAIRLVSGRWEDCETHTTCEHQANKGKPHEPVA